LAQILGGGCEKSRSHRLLLIETNYEPDSRELKPINLNRGQKFKAPVAMSTTPTSIKGLSGLIAKGLTGLF